MESLTKKCSNCGEERDLEDFSVDNAKKDGRRPECKDCHNSRRRSTITQSQKPPRSKYNQKELFCKQSIEAKFPGHIFEKVRLKEFVNPNTGRCLELDLFNANLNIAIEYNGRQHYEYVNFFHGEMEEFEKQKVRDLIKQGYCDVFNIELIEIPTLGTFKEIDDYISKCLSARGITTQVKQSKGSVECRGCGKIKNLLEFHVDEKGTGGHKTICKDCHNSVRKLQKPVNTAATKPKESDSPAEAREEMILSCRGLGKMTDYLDESSTKECFSCGEEKALGDFHADSSKRDGKRTICKTCRSPKKPVLNVVPKKSASFSKIRVELAIINETLKKVENYINDGDFIDIDCTAKLDEIQASYNLKFSELKEEYYKLRNPSLNKFQLD